MGINTGMTTAATADAARRPSAVRTLIVLLQVTAAATVAVEVLNFWYAPEQGFPLAVRTSWALLRSIGFLVLVWHVRRGRVSARPLGLILVITTIFAIGRLVVPREGLPPAPGVAGFAALTALGLAVLWSLYRNRAVGEFLVRHQPRLVIDRTGLTWTQAAPRRAPATGWLWTARVAAFTYPPLMLVPCLASIGSVPQAGLGAVPLVGFWFLAGIVASWAIAVTIIFLMRGRRWARKLLVGITVVVLLVDLPLCWLLLGVDGLVRDGAPLVAAAALAMYATWRAGRAERRVERVPAGDVAAVL